MRCFAVYDGDAELKLGRGTGKQQAFVRKKQQTNMNMAGSIHHVHLHTRLSDLASRHEVVCQLAVTGAFCVTSMSETTELNRKAGAGPLETVNRVLGLQLGFRLGLAEVDGPKPWPFFKAWFTAVEISLSPMINNKRKTILYLISQKFMRQELIIPRKSGIPLEPSFTLENFSYQ